MNFRITLLSAVLVVGLLLAPVVTAHHNGEQGDTVSNSDDVHAHYAGGGPNPGASGIFIALCDPLIGEETCTMGHRFDYPHPNGPDSAYLYVFDNAPDINRNNVSAAFFPFPETEHDHSTGSHSGFDDHYFCTEATFDVGAINGSYENSDSDNQPGDNMTDIDVFPVYTANEPVTNTPKMAPCDTTASSAVTFSNLTNYPTKGEVIVDWGDDSNDVTFGQDEHTCGDGHNEMEDGSNTGC